MFALIKQCIEVQFFSGKIEIRGKLFKKDQIARNGFAPYLQSWFQSLQYPADSHQRTNWHHLPCILQIKIESHIRLFILTPECLTIVYVVCHTIFIENQCLENTVINAINLFHLNYGHVKKNYTNIIWKVVKVSLQCSYVHLGLT